MQLSLISHSPDLIRLIDDGYEVQVQDGLLLVHHIPYVNSERTVAYGTLVSELTLAGEVTTRPGNHVAQFAGGIPCDVDGKPLEKIINSTGRAIAGANLEVHCSFSSKPPDGYADYYLKMTSYAAMISAPANVIEPSATARTFRVHESDSSDSPFAYLDTASARIGISAIGTRLAVSKVAVVGLGGTGAYILDLLAKCPIRELHLYDGDRLLQHNAFRSPGAIGLEELQGAPFKAEFYAGVYGRLHRGLVAHAYYIDQFNVNELAEMDFVFIAIDSSSARSLIIAELTSFRVAFIDVGMGVIEVDGRLTGLLRTTKSGADARYFPMADSDQPNEYATNIQIAELNALNATLGVLLWKKHVGFYFDDEHAHHSVYHIDGNAIVNGEFNCDA
jgi:molybdopterin/thiamine biosynthesis adenylyltransferase